MNKVPFCLTGVTQLLKCVFFRFTYKAHLIQAGLAKTVFYQLVSFLCPVGERWLWNGRQCYLYVFSKWYPVKRFYLHILCNLFLAFFSNDLSLGNFFRKFSFLCFCARYNEKAVLQLWLKSLPIPLQSTTLPKMELFNMYFSIILIIVENTFQRLHLISE